VPTGAAAVLAASRLHPAKPLKRREIAERRIRDKEDVAAVAAVAPVGAALRHELLAAEAQPPVAPLAGLNVDRCAVAEHARTVPPSPLRAWPPGTRPLVRPGDGA